MCILFITSHQCIRKSECCILMLFWNFIILFILGIWLHCNGVLGSSPDGLIRRPAAFGFSYQNPGLADILKISNVKPEILEVKCPFSAKNMTIPEAIEKVHDFCLGNNSVYVFVWIRFMYWDITLNNSNILVWINLSTI